MNRRLIRALLLLSLVALLAGCAARPPSSPGVEPVGGQAALEPDKATPPADASLASTFAAPPGWRLLYHRPGFSARDAVDLRAVGDIMLARGVEHALRAHDSRWLFAPTRHLLRGDVVVGNLESPFTTRRRPEQLRPGPYRLPADPALAPAVEPFTALSLANNHALDAGPAGLVDAARTLSAAGIAALGLHGDGCPPSAPPAGSAPPPVHLLAFNAVVDPQDRPADELACGRVPLDEAAIMEVARLRRASSTPIVALVHWGAEYAAEPNAAQRDWAGRLVAAGADLVLGAHPHVVQPAEPLEVAGRRGFVAYSLGNFVFDQPDRPATSHGLVLRAWLDRDGVGAVAVVPVAIVAGRPLPLPLDDPRAAEQLAAISSTTAEPHPTQPSRDREEASPSIPAGGQSQPSRDREGASLQAWRWNGADWDPAPVPPGVSLPPPRTEWRVDLRGDGEPLRATLSDGVAEIHDGERVVWRNESPDWHVAGLVPGDADADGRFELLLRLWKPDASGKLRTHPFMVGWRGGHYRVFWGGSAVARPIQDAALGPVGGHRAALVVLEGGQAPDDPAEHVSLWTWQSWTFAQQWQSPPGAYTRLALLDLDADGALEIVAENLAEASREP